MENNKTKKSAKKINIKYGNGVDKKTPEVVDKYLVELHKEIDEVRSLVDKQNDRFVKRGIECLGSNEDRNYLQYLYAQLDDYVDNGVKWEDKYTTKDEQPIMAQGYMQTDIPSIYHNLKPFIQDDQKTITEKRTELECLVNNIDLNNEILYNNYRTLYTLVCRLQPFEDPDLTENMDGKKESIGTIEILKNKFNIYSNLNSKVRSIINYLESIV